jgi:hypothetical protein
MNTSLFSNWVHAVNPHPVVAQQILIVLEHFEAEHGPEATEGLLRRSTRSNWQPDKWADVLSGQGQDVTPIMDAIQATKGSVVIPQPRVVEDNFFRKHRPGAQPVSEPVEAPVEPEPKENWLQKMLKKKSDPKKNDNQAPDPEPGPQEKSSKKKWILLAAGVALVLVLGAVLFAAFGGSQPSYHYSDSSTPTGVTALPTTDPGLLQDPLPSADQSFWSGLRNIKVPELSPGNLEGQLNATTAVGLFLMVALTLWAIGEGGVRKKGQNGAMFFSAVALLAGWLTMPILTIISIQSLGWFILGLLFVTTLWVLTASTIWSQNDLSPITVALAIFTASMFYYGKLTIITSIGALFGVAWGAWTGVTSMGGIITLLMTGRADAAFLSILIIVLGLLVIYMASVEVGKKHGPWSALVIGVIIIIVFYLSSWGLSSLAQWLINTQDPSIIITVVIKVLVPVLSWVASLLLAVGIGVALGDVEVGRSENKQRIGLERTGTFVQNIADFGILGTIIPLFLGVIIVLF